MAEPPPRLFDPDPPTAVEAARQMAKIRPAARHGQPGSAWDAALAITANAGTIRWRVLDLFVQVGPGGLTNLEIEDMLLLARPTGSNRRLELEQHGLVERRGDDKRTFYDSQPAQVYVVTPLGLAVHRYHEDSR